MIVNKTKYKINRDLSSILTPMNRMKRNSENAKRRFRLAAIQISGFLHLLIIPVME